MADGPHPDSVLRYGVSGRQVQLKVHQCVWSGNYIPNSLAAVQECYRARVARAEIDIAMLADEDFLVVHDMDAIVGEPYPTLLEAGADVITTETPAELVRAVPEA